MNLSIDMHKNLASKRNRKTFVILQHFADDILLAVYASASINIHYVHFFLHIFRCIHYLL